MVWPLYSLYCPLKLTLTKEKTWLSWTSLRPRCPVWSCVFLRRLVASGRVGNARISSRSPFLAANSDLNEHLFGLGCWDHPARGAVIKLSNNNSKVGICWNMLAWFASGKLLPWTWKYRSVVVLLVLEFENMHISENHSHSRGSTSERLWSAERDKTSSLDTKPRLSYDASSDPHTK